MTVKVCDVIMGAGKTTAAITQMNSDHDSRYIFITPYLEEVERIKRCCSERDFRDPQNKGEGKLEDLHRLLQTGSNIASTHALFRAYNEDTLSLIRDGGYKLILDEVMEVVDSIHISPKDLEMLLNEKMIEVDHDGRVHWLYDGYEGEFEDLRDTCMTGNVVLYNGCLMLWLFPIEVFDAFKDVIILTYMFDAQIQKYYFDMNGIQIRYIGTVYEQGEYHFCDCKHIPEYVETLKDKIHILDDKKLNEIGDSYTNLSSTWYTKAYKYKGRPQIKQLRNNLINVFSHKFESSSDQNLWTCFKDYQEILKGKGYTKGFVSCNVRATNAYRDRDRLAYCVNIFYNPLLKNYFLDHGVVVREDMFALSEMIQWIWRSAIRDGKEIWVYIPSRRMRELLMEWLKNLSFSFSNSQN